MKKFIVAAIAATVLVGPMAGVTWATDNDVCVPVAAYTEVIEHPAVMHIVHHEAVPAVASVWQNFSPNKDNKPFEGPPSHPVDERGTWHHKDKEIPPGHAGPDGVYQKGNGNGSWFYRQAAVEGVAAFDEVVVDVEAYTETINHPAVDCPIVVTPEPTPTPTVPPVVEEPNVEKPELGTGVQRPAQPVDEETTELPATGAEQTAGILLGALFLLAGGTAAVWFYRNR